MCNYCWHNQALSKRLQRFLDIFSKYLFNFQRDLMLTNIISWRIWWAKWLVKKWRYVVCIFFPFTLRGLFCNCLVKVFSLFLLLYQKSKGVQQEQQPKSVLPFTTDDFKACNEDKLKALETYLESRTYLFKYEPSSIDREVFIGIRDRDLSSSWQNFPNIERWYKHIKSFNDEEQRRFTVFHGWSYLQWLDLWFMHDFCFLCRY